MLRRFLFLMVLILGIGTSANATKFYADLSSCPTIGNAAWNEETNTFSWTTPTYASMIIPGLNGDLSDYTTLVLETENLQNNSSTATSASFRIDMFLENGTNSGEQLVGTNYGMAWSEAGTLIVDLKSKFTDEQLSRVKEFRINTNSDAGSVILKSVYLVKPFKLTFDESGKAYILPSDLSELAVGVEVDDQTGEIIKTETGPASITLELGDVDFSNVTSIISDYDNSSDGYNDLLNNVFIQQVSGEGVRDGWYSSKYNIYYNDEDRARSKHVSKMVLNFNSDGDNATGKMKISSICITKSVITVSDFVPLTRDDYFTWTLPTIEGEKVNKVQYFDYHLGEEVAPGGTVYGDVNVYYLNYVDLTGAESLKVKGSKGMIVRFLFNRITDQGNYVEKNVTIGEDGTALIDLSEFDYVHLNAVKSNWGSPTGVVDAIGYVKNGIDYYLAGSGDMFSVMNVLSDASVTCIDVTGLTNTTPLELNSANPNCLFIASNVATLSNVKNVIIKGDDGNVCENLQINSDYSFRAPFDFTAENASTSKSVSSAGFATFVLPYDCGGAEDAEAYAVNSINGNELQCTPVSQIKANEPVLLSKEGEYSFIANNVEVLANANPQSGCLTGTYEATTAPKGSYVLQKQNGVVAFYKVAEDKAQQVVPFSAYLVLDEANANRLTISLDQTTSLTNSNADGVVTIEAVYDLTGTQRNAMQRGINIVKLSDGSVRKIIVK